jgi:PilZ domain
MAQPSFAERLSRYAVALPFAYRGPGRDAVPPAVGWARDLSERGAWIELPEALAVATDLEVRFGTGADTPWLPAQVAWAHPEPARPRCHLHGLTFARLTPAQTDHLRALLAQERPRGTLRCYCGLAVNCRRPDGVGGALHGQIRDLSEGGAALRLPARVPPGTPLRVDAETAFGTITAEAQVVWAEAPASLPPGALFRHGVRFRRVGMASGLPLSVFLAGLR